MKRDRASRSNEKSRKTVDDHAWRAVFFLWIQQSSIVYTLIIFEMIFKLQKVTLSREINNFFIAREC